MSDLLRGLGIDQLSVDDRLELISQIWDSLTETATDLLVQDWHLAEADRRLASAEAQPGAGAPSEIVMARLAKPPT